MLVYLRVCLDFLAGSSAFDIAVIRHLIIYYCLVAIRKHSLLTVTCRYAATGRLLSGLVPLTSL
jgi:hypothetical protein